MDLGLGGETFGVEKRAGKNPGHGKRKIKMLYLDVFGFIPKTAWMASSWVGALVDAGSLQPVHLT